ncbi:MAG: hypothetical protein LLG04_04365 [Parachlamydia sp.]|nr:hypothetical protein [Parachlamydia sp.]
MSSKSILAAGVHGVRGALLACINVTNVGETEYYKLVKQIKFLEKIMSIQSTSLQKPQLVYQHIKEEPLKHFVAENLDIDAKLFHITRNFAARDKPFGINHFVAKILGRKYFEPKPSHIMYNFFARDKGLDINIKPPFAVEKRDITHNLADWRNPLGIELYAAVALQDPFLACNLQYEDSKNRLIVARPLRELGAHVRTRKLPSLRLVARAIKALALSIFRWHLCDSILIQVDNSIFHNQKGPLEICTCEKLKKDHPYLFQSALHYEFIPSLSLRKTQIMTMKQINAQSLEELCRRWCNIALMSKEKGSTLSNLLKSKQLKMLKKVAMT